MKTNFQKKIFLFTGIFLGLAAWDADAKVKRTVYRIVVEEEETEGVAAKKKAKPPVKKWVKPPVIQQTKKTPPLPQKTFFVERKVASVPTLEEVRIPERIVYREKLPAHEAQRMYWTNFRLQSVGAMQNRGGHSFTFEPTWNPEYRLDSHWSLGLNTGWAMYEEQTHKSDFSIVEYQAFAAHRFGRSGFALEVAAGMQTIFGAAFWNGTYPLLSVVPQFRLSEKEWAVDRIILGYSSFLYPAHYTHIFKFGVGFSF